MPNNLVEFKGNKVDKFGRILNKKKLKVIKGQWNGILSLLLNLKITYLAICSQIWPNIAFKNIFN